MNTPKSELYELLLSLSAAEKRAFRQYAERGIRNGELPRYFQLYERVLEMESTDENEIRESLKDSNLHKRFSEHKHALQEAILKVLADQHADAHINFQIRQLLTEYQILAGKGHTALAYRRLQKARELSERHERYLYIQEIADEEKELLLMGIAGSELENRLQEIVEREQQAMQNARIVNDQLTEWVRISTFYFSHIRARSETDLKHMKEMIDHPVYTQPGHLRLLRSRLINCSNQVVYHTMAGEYHQALSILEATLEDIESVPHRIFEYPNSYKYLIRNNLQIRIRLNRVDEHFYKRLRRLTERYPYESRGDDIINQFGSISLELSARTRSGEFSKAYERLGRARELLEAHPGAAQADAGMIIFNAFYTCFGVGQHKQALEWLRRLADGTEVHQRKDLLSLSPLMEILTHFELGNIDLLPYLVRNTERYYSKNHPEREFERLMLRYFKRMDLPELSTKEQRQFVMPPKI